MASAVGENEGGTQRTQLTCFASGADVLSRGRLVVGMDAARAVAFDDVSGRGEAGEPCRSRGAGDSMASGTRKEAPDYSFA